MTSPRDASTKRTPRYSEQLEGMTLEGGWRVLSIVPRADGQTGGLYSTSYLVESLDGTRGFLKAMDFSAAFSESDITAALKPLVDAFEFERDLLRECRGRRMDRVVLALADGTATVDAQAQLGRVPYIIFERGDGDIRGHLRSLLQIEVVSVLKVLHNIALGLRQLHAAGVAHQDLKPSNVMIFNAGRVPAKLGDLGHAVRQGVPLARPEHDVVGGDYRHAPPEQLYNDAPQDWRTHRVGADLYHLGSMAVFLFSRVNMTALLRAELSPEHWHERWNGKPTELRPYLRDAFDRAVRKFASEVPADIRQDIEATVRQLCEPDPALRGHPRARAIKHGDPYSLEQYISQFSALAARVQRSLLIRTK